MSETTRDLVERLLVCQHESWKHGQPVLVEALLRINPALPPQAEEVLDLIYNEIFLRDAATRPANTFSVSQFKAAPTQFDVQRFQGSDLGAAPPWRPRRPCSSSPVPGYEILGKSVAAAWARLRARQLSLRRVVALKMIQNDRIDARLLARFRAEAEAVARVQHPNIVQIFEVGEIQGRPYFSLELVEGQSLGRRLGGTAQPFRDSARLIEILARAIHVAHQRGIIHRDLKPANVLLTQTGIPKITDFGLAKRLDDPALNLTRSGEILGTPNYMAPEQAQGQTQDVGPATDVYALGAILYEMVTGRPPFTGKTVMEVVVRVGTEPAEPPSRWRANVPRDLEAICLKCLQKKPMDRYPSAAALADDLHRSGGRPTEARSVGRASRGWRRRPAAARCSALVSLATLPRGVHLVRIRQIRPRARRTERCRSATTQKALRKRTRAGCRSAERLNRVQRDRAQARGRSLTSKNHGATNMPCSYRRWPRCGPAIRSKAANCSTTPVAALSICATSPGVYCGAAVPAAAASSSAIAAPGLPCGFRPTAGSSPPPAPITPSRSGTSRPARFGTRSPGTAIAFMAWPSVRIASAWPRRAQTMP